MENTTQVIENVANEVSTNIEKPSIGEMTLGQLLNHVLSLWLNPGDRISRGEYILAWLSFSIITSLIWLLSYKALGLSVYSMFSVFLDIISLIMWIRFMVARLHDRNKSWRNALWILWFFIFLIAIGIFAWLVLMTTWWNIGNIKSLANGNTSLFIIILLILLVIIYVMTMFIIGCIKLVFFKWTPGDNQYGHDPLLRQDTSDSNYWILAIIWIIFSIAISLWLPKNQNMNMWWNGQNLFAPNWYDLDKTTDLNLNRDINPDSNWNLPTDDKAITQ